MQTYSVVTFRTRLAILFLFSWCVVKVNKRSVWTFLAAFRHIADGIRVKSSWKGNHNEPVYSIYS